VEDKWTQEIDRIEKRNKCLKAAIEELEEIVSNNMEYLAGLRLIRQNTPEDFKDLPEGIGLDKTI
jgi:hypothetical protein